nr:lpqD [Rhodococcus sp. JVH1]
MYRRLSTISTAAAALTTAFCLTACATTPDSAHSAEQTATRGETAPITLTLMRHAESAGNASGLIDTSIPGPGITDKGRQEAQAAAYRFAGQDFDGVSRPRWYEHSKPPTTWPTP